MVKLPPITTKTIVDLQTAEIVVVTTKAKVKVRRAINLRTAASVQVEDNSKRAKAEEAMLPQLVLRIGWDKHRESATAPLTLPISQNQKVAHQNYEGVSEIKKFDKLDYLW